MDLKQQLTADMKTAMKAKDKSRLKSVRAIIGAIKQFEIDNRVDVDDTKVLQIINKMVKQRKDSIEQFEKASRDDLIAIEQEELDVIATYMPKQLTINEIEESVDLAITETGLSAMSDMGKLMGSLKSKLDGLADMSIVNKILKEKLQ